MGRSARERQPPCKGLGTRLIEQRDLFGRQAQVQRGERFLKLRDTRRTCQRCRDAELRVGPRDRDGRQRGSGFSCYPIHCLQHAQSASFEILDVPQAPRTLVEVVLGPVLSSQEAVREAVEGDDPKTVGQRGVAKLALQLRTLERLYQV